MKSISRRRFVKSSMATGLAMGGAPALIRGSSARAAGPNDVVRIAVIGLGSTTAVGGVGGRGHQLIGRLRGISGARIVALCDADQAHLDREVQAARDVEGKVATYSDPRRVFDDKNIDAVIVALPNHWHALATVWACQAGKDVYCEKPFSYNIWEGQQMVAAARKYDRMVQVGTQNRSSTFLRRAFERLKAGELGAIQSAHTLVYRARDGIGTVDVPTAPPGTLDYDLWCGPSAKTPLMRKQLHYEWHWFWDTGNGELGNNGIHVIDIARWALGQDQPPPRAMSIGGRFGFHDCGETANTQVVMLDYKPAPLFCEIRNLSAAKGPEPLGKFKGRSMGVVIDCEGGYFAGDATGAAFFDRQGKKVQTLSDPDNSGALETAHLTSFITAVRSRQKSDLAAESIQGHISTACCHLGNVSHRIGKLAAPEAIHAATSGNAELADAFDRCREVLQKNGVDLNTNQATLGPWVTFDAQKGHFTGDFADAANELSRRVYREPYVVPEISAS